AYLALNMLSGLFQIGQMGAQGLIGVCVMIVPLAVGVWQLMWLIAAVRTSGQLRSMQSQMQMQYCQMMAMQQQQQQQYQQMIQQQMVTPPPAPVQNSEVRSQNSE